MRVENVFVSLATGLLLSSASHALEPMAAEELSEIVAQEGIRLGLELRLNTDENGLPLTNGTDFANCDSDTNFSSTGCRLALQFANRNDLGGEWIVVKNFYGYMKIPSIYLDAGRTPVAPTQYEDLNRFRDSDGVPLLATPHDISVVAFSFPEEIEFGLHLGGINIEYGATGYLNNNFEPFLGVEVGNVDGGPAVLKAEGTMYWYGF